MTNDLVLTPGGVRRRSQVHNIQAGALLDGAHGQLRLLNPAGDVLKEFGAHPQRPRGQPLMPRNVAHPEDRNPAFGSGWITYASWANSTGTPVSRFSTRWTVPPEPAAQNGQTIFLFNGIQNSTMIYQPVLQWGSSAAGGGNYWAVASWYVDGQGGPAFHSNLVRVNVGDVLTGVITLTGQTSMGFSYNCEFPGIANTGLPVTNIGQLTWLIQTLEAYGITSCSDYPATSKTTMSAIDIQTGTNRPTVAWTVNNTVTECGQHTLLFDNDVMGSGGVDLWYSPSPFWVYGFGTIAPGESQDWWFSWGGTGDVGPQLIQAEPLNQSGELATTQIAESLDGNGHLTYHATVQNNGANAVGFQWRGGGR